MSSRASTRVGTPASIAATMTVSALVSKSCHEACDFSGGRNPPKILRICLFSPSSASCPLADKPVSDVDLLAAIARAEKQDSQSRSANARLNSINDKLAMLTPRECELMTHVIAGQLNKQIAADIGIVEKDNEASPRQSDAQAWRTLGCRPRPPGREGRNYRRTILARDIAVLDLSLARQSAVTKPIVRHMSQPSPWIAIVDDDPSVLKALARLLTLRAMEVKTYEFGPGLPGIRCSDKLPECLIVDLQMPEMTGLELQRHLNHAGIGFRPS